MDFTIKKYKELLYKLIERGYNFQTLEEFVSNPKEKTIVLRHDVDLKPKKSLEFAKIQNLFGIKGSYYFRIIEESFDEKIIKEISSLGHEIGYHYESLTTCRGNVDKAFDDFKSNLSKLRKITSILTITMHGSPKSRYDSKDIWNKYNYNDLGIIAEPYFDIDFTKILYLSDTGRMWDGWKVSVRDKVLPQIEWRKNGYIFHSTDDIINKIDKMPNQIVFTFHPQRWHNNIVLWFRELTMQNIKNIVKRTIIYFRKII